MNLIWKLALNNIFRNHRRTVATLFTVCFGYVGLVLTGGYILYVEKSTQALTVYINHGGHIVIYKKDGLENFFAKPKKYQIDTQLLNQINGVLDRHPEQIEKVGTYLSGMGLLSNGATSTPVIMLGITPAIDKYVWNHPYVRKYTPSFIPTKDTKEFSEFVRVNQDSISITQDLGELIARKGPFDSLSESERDIQLAAKTFLGDFNAVNGFLGPQHSTGFPYIEDLSVMMPLQSLKNLLLTDGISSMALYLKENISTHRFIDILQSEFDANKIAVDLYPFYGEDVGMVYAGTMGFILSIGGFFFILILGAVTLSIANTITIGIIERTKEIGTLRALGYEPNHLTSLFVKENLIISTLCVVVGLLFSEGIAYAINNAGIMFRPAGISRDIPFMVLPELWLSCLIAIPVVLLTCLTAYVVAKRKTSLSLIHLLTDSAG